MADWTKGPWIASEADWFGDQNIQSKEGVETGTCHLAIAAVVSNMRPADEVAANANLIAAAPALYEALEGLERYLRDTPHHNAVEAAAARAALAQARGGV